MTNIVERLRSIDISWSDEGELAAEAADELAASQAREKVLRDALEFVLDTNFCTGDDGELAREDAFHLLSKPTDDTALREYVNNSPEGKLLDEIGKLLDGIDYKGSYVDGIKAALTSERERCAKVCRNLTSANNFMCAEAIRELGEEK